MHPDQQDQAPVTLIGPAIGVIARQGMAWLELPSGERRYVESELRIGRGEQNDLRLNDGSVSRYHAFLRRVDGRYLRIVTVLFLDLQGFTAMSENMPPDQVTQMMNRCFERLTATVARFGGYVDKYVGDAMM